MKTTMTLTLEGFPYLILRQAEAIGLGKTKAEIIRQALFAYAEKYNIDVDEAAYAMAADDILRKGGFRKAKGMKELVP